LQEARVKTRERLDFRRVAEREVVGVEEEHDPLAGVLGERHGPGLVDSPQVRVDEGVRGGKADRYGRHGDLERTEWRGLSLSLFRTVTSYPESRQTRRDRLTLTAADRAPWISAAIS